MLRAALMIAFLAASAMAGPVVLTKATFESEVFNSGKNAFIKFYAPWCGHCKAMAPAWNQLGDEYAGSSSVLIADVDCTIESELCQENGATGYPTIKYWTAESAKDGEKYQGGRDFEALKKHVQDKLERSCDVSDPTTCDEKEQKFLSQMQAKDAGEVTTQLARLEGMRDQKMKPELKAWLFKRVNILKQLSRKDEL